jgi:hypothetical protein
MAVGSDNAMHLSWVWRETWDVSTNHDIGYAKSTDGGKTWMKSSGEPYVLPITAASAELAARISQGSGLMNQTSIAADLRGRPIIATYWTPEGSDVPQYHLVWHDGTAWNVRQISKRRTPFPLEGGGTKKVPISRPQIMIDAGGIVRVVVRDTERNNLISMGACENLGQNRWTWTDLTSFSLGQWEPTYDTELWNSQNALHLLIQNVGQGDSETTVDIPPQMVSALEWEDPHAEK